MEIDFGASMPRHTCRPRTAKTVTTMSSPIRIRSPTFRLRASIALSLRSLGTTCPANEIAYLRTSLRDPHIHTYFVKACARGILVFPKFRDDCHGRGAKGMPERGSIDFVG